MTNSARLIRGGLSRAETDHLNAEAWRVRDTAPGRAGELCRLTRRRAEETDYRRGVGQARIVDAHLAAARGDLDDATRSALLALPDLEPDGPTTWLAWAHILIGRISGDVGETERAAHHLTSALEVATGVGDVEAHADAAVSVAELAPPPGGVTAALRAAVAELAEADLPIALGRARTALCTRLLDAGATAEARAVAEVAATDAAAVGLPSTVLACRSVQARALAAEGSVDAALRLVHETLLTTKDAAPDVVAAAGALVGELQHDHGDVRGAVDSLLDVRETLGPDDVATEPLTRRLSEYYAELGDYGAAYEMLRVHREQRDAIADATVRRRVAVLHVLYEEGDAAPVPDEALARIAALSAPNDAEPVVPGTDERVALRRSRRRTQPAGPPTGVERRAADTDDPQLRDALTSLPNARALDRRLAAVAARTSRSAVCLALIDIDGLAVVNAERGRLVGDSALRQVADVLGAQVPPDALLARLVGEDFGLLLEDFSLEEGQALCERLRAAVEGQPLAAELHGRVFTVSIGVAAATTPFDAERLVRVADDALYEAKDAGRNRVAGRDTSPAADPRATGR